MGFKAIKQKVICCLKTGMVHHEQRNNIDIKNILATGVLTCEQVATIISRARGDDYSSSPHHFDNSIDVHIVKTRFAGFHWYIKWYFIDENTVFISVHHSRRNGTNNEGVGHANS